MCLSKARRTLAQPEKSKWGRLIPDSPTDLRGRLWELPGCWGQNLPKAPTSAARSQSRRLPQVSVYCGYHGNAIPPPGWAETGGPRGACAALRPLSGKRQGGGRGTLDLACPLARLFRGP